MSDQTEDFEVHTCLPQLEILAIRTAGKPVNPLIFSMQVEDAHRECEACTPSDHPREARA